MTLKIRSERLGKNFLSMKRDDLMMEHFLMFNNQKDLNYNDHYFLCRLLAHGGRIWGKNNADGKGATFTFSLPLQLENGQPANVTKPFVFTIS
jgi:hypothetical protein